MLKKILIITLLATCSTSFAEGTLTEQLKASIDSNNMRIVYVTYGGSVEYGLHPNRKFTFAKRGNDFYVQKDFPLVRPIDPKEMYKKMKESGTKIGHGGLFGFSLPKKNKKEIIDSQKDNEQTAYTLSDDEVIGYGGLLIRNQYNICLQPRQESLNMPVNYGHGISGFIAGAGMQMAQHKIQQMQKKAAEAPNVELYDLCVRKDDKIYMLNRGVQRGSWLSIEDATPDKLSIPTLQILGEFKFSSNALNVLLSKPGEYNVKYVKSYEQNINGENYLGEEFSSEQLNDVGLSYAPATNFTLFYKDGKLAFIDEGSNGAIAMADMAGNNPLGVKFTHKYLTKIIALDANIDDYVFRSLKHYEIGKQKLRDE
ncbi:MAG: hypothetical protein IJR05_01435 [Acidaminococcaceae bacterium]|nr:hypothetical protein [Acidaminococcaceae bacterium]